MVSHAFGKSIVRASGEVDLASGGVLLAQILLQRLIEGQMDDIERHHGGDVALERSLSL